jgi:hypothetical protein
MCSPPWEPDRVGRNEAAHRRETPRKKEGLEECYETNSEKKYAEGITEATPARWDASCFRAVGFVARGRTAFRNWRRDEVQGRMMRIEWAGRFTWASNRSNRGLR